jgi:hypothetical protein
MYTRGLLLFGVLLFGVTCSPVVAQGVAQEQPKESLLLLVRCNPEVTPERIMETLKQATVQAQCEISEIRIQEVAGHVLDQIEGMIRGIDPRDVSVQVAGEIHLARRPTVEAVWEFQLRSAPEEIIRQLEVGFAKKDVSEKEEMKWEAYSAVPPEELDPRKGGIAAVSLRNGRYEFYAPGELGIPRKFRLHLVREDGSTRSIEGEFPLLDRYYMIHLGGFQGDRARLFTAVRDPELVANPFSDIQERMTVSVVFGNIQATTAVVGETIDGLELVVSVPGVPNRSPARVWMLFPLDEERLASEEAALKAMKDISSALPEEIRKRAVWVTDSQQPVVSLDGPRWYELAPTGSGFEHRIKLVSDPKEFARLRERFPRVYRILVWEFERGRVRSPILVDGGRPYRSEELNSWGRLLENQVQMEAPGSP